MIRKKVRSFWTSTSFFLLKISKMSIFSGNFGENQNFQKIMKNRKIIFSDNFLKIWDFRKFQIFRDFSTFFGGRCSKWPNFFPNQPFSKKMTCRFCKIWRRWRWKWLEVQPQRHFSQNGAAKSEMSRSQHFADFQPPAGFCIKSWEWI